MRNYSIAFLDVDGTLLDREHRVPRLAGELLNKLHRRQVPVVLASARSPQGLAPIREQLGFQDTAICYAGALAVLPGGRILYDHGIPAADAVRLEELIRAEYPAVALSAYLYDIWLTPDPEHPAIRQEAAITACQPMANPLGLPSQRLGDVHKLLCIGPEHQITALQRQLTAQFPGITALRSKPTYLEILARGVCKEEAAAAVLDHYGLPPERAVACGDGEVDAGLLRLAGLGVAMGNSSASAREAADFISSSNDEEGVYVALHRLRFVPPDQP